MKVARLVILVFVVTLAMNAVGTSPTLASSPEFRVLPSTKTFSSTSGVSIMAAATTSLTCHAHTAKGEITSMDAVGKLVVTFNGCVVQTGSCTAKANSVTGKTGEIVTNRIRGLLGTVKTSEAASGVGLLFEPESGNTKFLTLAATACTPESTTNGNLAGESDPCRQVAKERQTNLDRNRRQTEDQRNSGVRTESPTRTRSLWRNSQRNRNRRRRIPRSDRNKLRT